jgi:hypothetical protein
MKEAVNQVLPQFQAQLSMSGIQSPSQLASNKSSSGGDGFDYDKMGRAVRDAMLQVTG